MSWLEAIAAVVVPLAAVVTALINYRRAVEVERWRTRRRILSRRHPSDYQINADERVAIDELDARGGPAL